MRSDAVNSGSVKMDVMGPSDAVRKALAEVETDRVKRGVPPATLEPGETLLVEWWVVLRLWNEAMAAYDALRPMGYAQYIFGETTHWPNVSDSLQLWSQQRLMDGQYALPPQGNPAVPPRRDHGHGNEQKPCAGCGKTASQAEVDGKPLKQCARCKAVAYCSQDCQRRDWKAGHKRVCQM
mmetsp:Transcript_52007/g.153475  ORF Transcript_52007/g.153475 Transcript_52007/m.153475 type:complete len:180 (-) Transcript_52007:114-653(-)